VLVVIADTFDLFREGLAHALQGAGNTELRILTAYDALSLLDGLNGSRPADVAVIDLELPQLGGILGVSRVKASFPHTQIVVLGGEDKPQAIEDAFRIGALGYVPKTSSVAVMIAALNLVLAGGMYIPPQVLLPRLSQDVTDKTIAFPTWSTRADGSTPALTDRQLEILFHVAKGKPNKVIARDLKIAEGTVRIHLASIFRSLKVRNRTEAVMASRNLLPRVARPS
jgi:DNA-binding NarL/FixJ family response regulator